jgi:hypothetical protein
MSTSADLSSGPGLRLRQSGVESSNEQSPGTEQGTNQESPVAGASEETKAQKTYGRTPDGTGRPNTIANPNGPWLTFTCENSLCCTHNS